MAEVGDDCECRVEQCPQCQQEVVNKSLEDHFQEDCSHQVVLCELKYAGCDFEDLRCEMAQHMEFNRLHHLTLICEFTKEERDKHEELVKLVKEERDKLEKLDKLVKEERDKREKLDKHVKEESEKRKKLEKLLKEERSKCGRANVAIIGVIAVVVSIVYLARFESRVKILKDSLNKTDSNVQQLMEGFCKKYIDDSIQALYNTLAGYFNLLDYFKVFRTQTTHYIEDASSSQN